MAVVLLRGEGVPQVHAIVASAGIYFHVPELASELLGGKPVSRVLQAITYACKKGPHSQFGSIQASLVTNKASGMHDELYAKGVLKTDKDYGSKLLPMDKLQAFLSHFDRDHGRKTATAITAFIEQEKIKDSRSEAQPEKPAKKVKAMRKLPNRVYGLDDPPANVLKQKADMERWATGNVEFKGSFKGINKKVFNLYWAAGINPYLQYLHSEYGIAKDQLRFSITGAVTVFDKEKIEGFESYTQKIRNTDSFHHRANTFRALIFVAKFLIRNQIHDPLHPSKEMIFTQGLLSKKCNELQRLAREEGKPNMTEVPNWVDAKIVRGENSSILRARWQRTVNPQKRAKAGMRYMINSFFVRDATKRQSAIRKLQLYKRGKKQQRTIKLLRDFKVRLCYTGRGSYKVCSL